MDRIHSKDTIFALATGSGRAGLAVVRISGPSALECMAALGIKAPPPRAAVLRTLKAGSTGASIDDGVVLWFPGPHSFTGEDVVELQVHGGGAVLEAIFDVLRAVSEVRPAGPGEFSRRAVLNGKMDLTAAEGLLDLIDSETKAQREQALRQLRGGLAEIYDDWRARLIHVLAHVEAGIDFADEELPVDLQQDAMAQAKLIAREIEGHLDDTGRGELVRTGFRVAIIGAPNVGKSSLVNWLAARDVAIVTDQAGTTRDVIEVRLNLGGYSVVVADTAGIRPASDVIEAEGIRRAEAWARDSDLTIRLLDVYSEISDMEVGTEAELCVVNKIDLQPSRKWADLIMPISVETGDGLDNLLSVLEGQVQSRVAALDTPAITRVRHRQALQECVAALDRAGVAVEAGLEIALVSEDLRSAGHALGRITGRVDVEMLLDVVFRDFCIGK
jgi:tRNA modification GTPase